jgi:hypothetical protein
VQFPGKNKDTKIASKPIAIPIKRDYIQDNAHNMISKSNSPPSVFMEQLRKRLDQMATSPEFIYNLRN